MHMVFDILDMKFLVKFAANRLDPFVVIKKQKNIHMPLTALIHLVASTNEKKKTFPFSFHTQRDLGTRGTLHMVSEHKVTMLGPNGLINMQV